MKITKVGQPNNFDFLRTALAVLVIASHSFALGSGSEQNEPLQLVTHHQLTFGSLAVNCFFVISGFLVTASAERSTSLRTYFKKRIARIYPGFLTYSLLSLAVVMPLASAEVVGRSRFFQAADVVIQLARLREPHYRGAFLANPFPGVVNGSLWSIQYEFWCYVGLALLLSLGLLRRRFALLVFLLFTIVVSVLTQLRGWHFWGGPLKSLVGLSEFWARLLPLYLGGVVFYLYRDRIALKTRGAAAALAILGVACFWSAGWTAAFPLAGTYLIFYLVYVPKSLLQRFGRFGDLSYGTYLYAFPIQQLIMQRVAHPLAPWKLFLLATPPTLAMAAGSWFLVERRFLGPSRRKETPVHAFEAGGRVGGRK